MKDIYVARQPIFDAAQSVVAYELLYRSNGETQFADGLTASKMSSSVIVDGVLGMGLDSLTEGQTAFINLSEDMLLQGTAELLDPSQVVIELLESIQPTEQVIEECTSLHAAGYKLALDDFVYDERWDPLLELAEIVKVDVLDTGSAMPEALERLRRFDVLLLAEKVEDQAIHDRCVEQGFKYFQGFHYYRPETLTKKDMSSQSLAIVRLMNLLQNPGVTDREIEDAFKSDPSLTYKLLRIVNSAALGGRGVDSIAHALRLLGRDPLYRWLCLLLMTVGSDGGDLQTEVVKAALLRGRMCESVGDRVRSKVRDTPGGGSLFLIGMFSDIERVLGLPVSDVLEDIDVAPSVRSAILERDGTGGTILSAVDAYMDAEWDEAEGALAGVGAETDGLFDVYVDSVTWAGERMAFRKDGL